MGALRRGGEEHLGRGNDLVPEAVVLTDPELVEPELVETLGELEVALDRERRVLTGRVQRRVEHAEPEPRCHGAPSLSGVPWQRKRAALSVLARAEPDMSVPLTPENRNGFASRP